MLFRSSVTVPVALPLLDALPLTPVLTAVASVAYSGSVFVPTPVTAADGKLFLKAQIQVFKATKDGSGNITAWGRAASGGRRKPNWTFTFTRGQMPKPTEADPAPILHITLPIRNPKDDGLLGAPTSQPGRPYLDPSVSGGYPATYRWRIRYQYRLSNGNLKWGGGSITGGWNYDNLRSEEHTSELQSH